MSATLMATRRPRWNEKFAYLTYRIRRSPLTMAGLAITCIVLLCMIFAPWLAAELGRTPGAAIQQPLVRHRRSRSRPVQPRAVR